MDPQKRRSMARFTRAVSQSYNVLATTSRMDGSRNLGRSLAAIAAKNGPAEIAALVGSDGRRNVFTRKKRGAEVGKTKKGKGTKIMLMTDGQGLPLSVFTLAANFAEVNTLETLVEFRVCEKLPERLLYDKAADADWVRKRMKSCGVDLICPHRRGRKKPPMQDGRKLRRYVRRWKIERTIGWMFNYRRLITRHEYYAHLFEGFVQLTCMLIVLKRF